MRTERNYLAVFLFIAIAVPATVAGINWFVDPYGFFNSPVVSGVNALKPEMGFHEKELKAHRVTTLRPDGLILGASTSDVGLDPANSGWKAKQTYNLAVGQGSILLAQQFLQHAASFAAPRQVVLGLELAMFNPNLQVVKGLTPSSLAVNAQGERNRDYSPLNFYAKALSLDMLRSSVATAAVNRGKPAPMADQRAIGEFGQMNPASFPVNKWKVYPQRFQPRIAEHVRNYWAPIDQFVAIKEFSGTAPFAALEHILRMACEQDIDMHIVLSPVHAYIPEAKRLAGLWGLWERWIKAIVLLSEEVASRNDCRAVPVWDFSGYNDITTEVIPRSSKAALAPHWYWDAVHYKKPAGDKLLKRIFSGQQDPDYADFGVRLTSANVDQHLARTRKLAESYRKSHATEVQLVAATVQKNLAKTGNK